MSSLRSEKINNEMKREMSVLIREVKDPRVSSNMVSVMRAEVTKDLKFAKIYISIFGDDKKKEEVMEGLKSANSYLRREIGHRLNLRITPELHFVRDDSIEYGNHIMNVIKEINHGE